MSFQEKYTWVGLFVSIGVAVAYAVVILGQLGQTPVAQIAYQRPMLVAIGVSVVATIVGTIIMAIVSSIAVEITGQGSHKDIDRADERDKDISRRGELAGYYASSIGLVGALALAMLQQEHFWISNTIYASFVLASIASAAAKLVLYRRGF